MLPRPRLDLSGTPGLRPIGLSPGSWQTSLVLGSMSRYSAQILICITEYQNNSPRNGCWSTCPTEWCFFCHNSKAYPYMSRLLGAYLKRASNFDHWLPDLLNKQSIYICQSQKWQKCSTCITINIFIKVLIWVCYSLKGISLTWKKRIHYHLYSYHHILLSFIITMMTIYEGLFSISCNLYQLVLKQLWCCYN